MIRLLLSSAAVLGFASATQALGSSDNCIGGFGL